MRNGNPAPASTLIDDPVDDMALLRRYVERGSQDAFNLIVSRHLNWVHATCRKGLRDRHMAEDAAQAVFIILARRAATLAPQTRLSGWLFNTARFVIKDAKKQEARYRRRENVAREMNELRLSPVRDAVDGQTQGLLDDALATLTERDRHALLMHFYEGLSLQEMADTLGITKDGAKKRVGRALSRLRSRMARNGKTAAASIAVLALLLRSRAAEAAPLGMAQTVASSAIVPGVASSVAKWMAQRAMSTAAGASRRLLRALVAAEITAAVGLVGVWSMPSRPAPVVATGNTTAVAQSTHVVSEPAPPPPAPAPAPLAAQEPEGPYRSGAFDAEPRLDPLPPYPDSRQLSQNTNSPPDSTAAAGFGGSAGGTSGVSSVAPTRRVVAEQITLPQSIARVVAQSALATPSPASGSSSRSAAAAPAARRGSTPVASAQPSAPSPKVSPPDKVPSDPPVPSDPVVAPKPPVLPPIAKGPASWPGEFFRHHDPSQVPFHPEPHPQPHPDAHASYRPASLAQDWHDPEPEPPSTRDGHIEVALATRGEDDDDHFTDSIDARPWHLRRLYHHESDGDVAASTAAGRTKPFVARSGKQRTARAGGAHKPGSANFDGAVAADDSNQFVPFIRAQDVLGDAPPSARAAAQRGFVRREVMAPVSPFRHDADAFEIAPAAAADACALDAAPMSLPPVAFAQTPEPGTLGLTLLAAGAALLTRRGRRRHKPGN